MLVNLSEDCMNKKALTVITTKPDIIDDKNTIVVYLWICFTLASNFSCAFLTLLYSDVTSVAASAASKANLMLS